MPYPSYIAANLVAELQDVVVTLETIYNSHNIDPTAAAAFSLQVATAPAISATTPASTSPISGLYAGFVALYNTIPLLISDVTGVDVSLSAGLIALARGLGAAMSPGDAAAAFAAAADAAADPAPALPAWTATRAVDAGNSAIVARLARSVYLAPYVEALVGQDYQTRADAITAKADCVGRFERELSLCGLSDLDFAAALTDMRDAAVNYLALVIDARPVLMVTTPVSIPALLAAWRIYQDPARADDLVARNDVKVAEFMPVTFEALAPAA